MFGSSAFGMSLEVESKAAESCLAPRGLIPDRLGRCYAARPALERLQFRKAAEARRHARELHGLATIWAARRVGGCAHGFYQSAGLCLHLR